MYLRSALAIFALLALPATASAYEFLSEAGCAPGRGAAWSMALGPTMWWLHQDGLPSIPREELEDALALSVQAWSAPCCSGFAASYEGTTSASALDGSGWNVVQFEAERWPPELGSRRSTIAVTMPILTVDCRIVQADMLFNAANFRFTTDGKGGTDLQSIATHEFGHWLGLDHSDFPGSSMTPWYSGGLDERTLTTDDEAGVCALYPTSCPGCASDADCVEGERCDEATGVCKAIGCAGNDDCPMGTICEAETCVAGCRADGECAGDDVCLEGRCTRDPGACRICEPCAGAADCGPGHLCVDLGTGGVCTSFCESDADCGGDARCREMGGYSLCFAPNASAGDLCPWGYSCDGPSEASCPMLWERCISASGCLGGTCLTTAEGRFCSCACVSDADCGAGNACVTDPWGARSCAPAEEAACLYVQCEAGTLCSEGLCVDACDLISCGTAQRCEAGACVSVCGAPCAPGSYCDPEVGACVKGDPCEQIRCAEDEVCEADDAGVRCADPCDGRECPAGEICVAGACLQEDGTGSGGSGGGDGAGGGKADRPRRGGGCASADVGASLFALLASLGFVYRRP